MLLFFYIFHQPSLPIIPAAPTDNRFSLKSGHWNESYHGNRLSGPLISLSVCEHTHTPVKALFREHWTYVYLCIKLSSFLKFLNKKLYIYIYIYTLYIHCIPIIVVIGSYEVDNPPVFLLEEIASRAPTTVNTCNARRDTVAVAGKKNLNLLTHNLFWGRILTWDVFLPLL